jgi:hypothetical protein
MCPPDRDVTDTRYPAARYHFTGAGLSPAGTRQLLLTHHKSHLWKISTLRGVVDKVRTAMHCDMLIAGSAINDGWLQGQSIARDNTASTEHRGRVHGNNHTAFFGDFRRIFQQQPIKEKTPVGAWLGRESVISASEKINHYWIDDCTCAHRAREV